MGDSYENTIMPERPEETTSPDLIPVDDKGQPLPDPTEFLGSYLAPKGLDALKRSYEAAEEDASVKDTMDPMQPTTFFKKHKPGRRGYDYYGTPAGSIPNDSNGLEPSPLSQLFSEAEAVDPEFIEDENGEEIPFVPEEIEIRKGKVETPRQADAKPENLRDAFGGTDAQNADEQVFRTTTVKQDDDAPHILDLYKDSMKTKVIYQAAEESPATIGALSAEETQTLFAEPKKGSALQRRRRAKEEKRARKLQQKLDKKKAKEKRKAEKAARKAQRKAAKNAAEDSAAQTAENAAAQKAAEQQENAKQAQLAAEKERQEKEQLRQEARAAEEKARAEKAEAERLLEQANQQRDAALREAQQAVQEAEARLNKEKEALERRQKTVKENERRNKAAAKKLETEREAAKQAETAARQAREEAEKAKAELEKMRQEAQRALEQKQAAEVAAEAARQEKAKLEAQTAKLEEEQRQQAAERKQAQDAKATNTGSESAKPVSSPSNAETTQEIRRRIAEMESRLTSATESPAETAEDIYISAAGRKRPQENPALKIDKESIKSRSVKSKENNGN